MAEVGGLLASSRPLDAQFSEHMSLDTVTQCTHARVLTQQTIGALERQLAAEHIKLRMLENVEASLKQAPFFPPPAALPPARAPVAAPGGAPRVVKLRESASLTLLPSARYSDRSSGGL